MKANNYILATVLRCIIIAGLTIQGPLLNSFEVYAQQRVNHTNFSSSPMSEQQLENILLYAKKHVEVRATVNESGELFAEYKAVGIDKKLNREEQFIIGFYGLAALKHVVSDTISRSGFEAEDDLGNVRIRFTRQDAQNCRSLANSECFIELGGAQKLAFAQPKDTGFNIKSLFIGKAYAQQNSAEEKSFSQGFMDGLAIDWAEDALNAAISAGVGTIIGLFGGLGPWGWTVLGGVALYTVGSDVVTMGKHLWNGDYYEAGEVLGDLVKDLVISAVSGLAGGRAGSGLRNALKKAAEDNDNLGILARGILSIIEKIRTGLPAKSPTDNTSPRNDGNGPKRDASPDQSGPSSQPQNSGGQGSSKPKPQSEPAGQNQTSPQNSSNTAVLDKPGVDVMLPKPQPKPYARNAKADAMGVPINPNPPSTSVSSSSGSRLPITPPMSDDDVQAFDNISPQQSGFNFAVIPSQWGISEKTMMNLPAHPTVLDAENFGENYMVHMPKAGAINEWQVYKQVTSQNNMGTGRFSVPRVELWQKTYTGASEGTPYTNQDSPRTYIFAVQMLPGITNRSQGIEDQIFAKSIGNRQKQTIKAIDFFQSRQKRRSLSADILVYSGQTHYLVNNSDDNIHVRIRGAYNNDLTKSQAESILTGYNQWDIDIFENPPVPGLGDIYGVQSQDQWDRIQEQLNPSSLGQDELTRYMNLKVLFDPIDVRDIFSDIPPQELQRLREELERQDKEAQEKLRKSVSNRYMSDEQLVYDLIKNQNVTNRHLEALYRLKERCGLPAGERDVSDEICSMVARLLEHFETVMEAVDHKQQQDVKGKVDEIIDGISWIAQEDLSLIHEILFQLNPESINILLGIRRQRGPIHTNEYLIAVFNSYVTQLINEYREESLAERFQDNDDLETRVQNNIEGAKKFVLMAHNARRSNFLVPRQSTLNAINAQYDINKPKKLSSNFRDAGLELEINLEHVAEFITVTPEYNNLAEIVVSFYSNAKSALQRNSIENYLLENYSIESNESILTEIRNHLNGLRFDDFNAEAKAKFIRAMVYAYFENRGGGHNDWLPVFVSKPTWVVENEVNFLGRAYQAGDSVDISEILGTKELFFAAHDHAFKRVEMKFRFGEKEKLTSGEVETAMKELLLAMGIDGENLAYWMHLHNVAALPENFSNRLKRLRMFEHNLRVDQSAQFFEFELLLDPDRANHEDLWVRYMGGFFAQHIGAARSALNWVLGSGIKLEMDPKKFYRNPSYVALVGSDKYDFNEDEGYLYGQENRVVASNRISSELFNDGIQYGMVEQDYGISEEVFARWLQAMGHDINNLNIDAVVNDMYYLGADIVSVDSQSGANVDFERMYAQIPPRVKELLGHYQINNEDQFTDFFDLILARANIFVLFKDWGRTPIMYKHAEFLPFIEEAQLYYLQMLLTGGGPTEEKVGVISAQFVSSGLSYLQSNSVILHDN